jgi:mono/diheme cytochrome c family protein
MNDNTKNIVYGVLIGLPTMLIVWIFSLYFFGCGTTNSCTGIQLPEMTSIPTLVPATMPPPKVGAEAVAATPRCSVAALNLIDAWIAAGYPEKEPFTFTDAKGANCSANFNDDVHKLFIAPNLWFDGAPACTTCHHADVAKAIKNMDLSSYAGIVAGSNRLNGAPKGNDILGGGNPANSLLHQMLYAPGGKTLINRPPMPFGRPATAPAEGPVISAGIPAGTASNAPTAPTAAAAAGTAAATPAAPGTTTTPEATAAGTAAPAKSTPAATEEVARPSNPGGPGEAVNLKGDAATGAQIFIGRCAACHGDQGKQGIPNPGSDDGTVPPLNPIDQTMVSTDPLTFATNIDLFIQHGSKPAGPAPAIQMPAWGDQNMLSQQEIADLIAYIISLNK